MGFISAISSSENNSAFNLLCQVNSLGAYFNNEVFYGLVCRETKLQSDRSFILWLYLCKSLKLMAHHKSHFRDTCCQRASSVRKNVTLYCQ